ncbi:hypothetical protein UACE39S_00281 [Ureibacillus acetophenoni]
MQRPQKTLQDGCLQRDRLETEEYARACSTVVKEVGRFFLDLNNGYEFY